MKYKNQLLLALSCSVLFLSGCESLKNNSRNLTKPRVAQNFSDRYRLSFKFDGRDACVVKNSIKGFLVIDGNTYNMKRSKDNALVYYYDYELPNNRTKARYYFEFKFDYNKYASVKQKSFKSKIYNIDILSRYSIDLECDRGVVGSDVVIVGRGFTMDDSVLLGTEVCDSQYESQNVIKFTVPNISVGKKYPVKIVSDHDTIRVGEFFVDGGRLSANLDSLDITANETSVLIYMSETDALSEGIQLSLSTDIPDSIKFKNNPFIAVGSKTVSVVVQATEKSGSGSIFANADGFNELVIPVVVVGNEVEIDSLNINKNQLGASGDKTDISPITKLNVKSKSIFVE